jgi:hypothetical protein
MQKIDIKFRHEKMGELNMKFQECSTNKELKLATGNSALFQSKFPA